MHLLGKMVNYMKQNRKATNKQTKPGSIIKLQFLKIRLNMAVSFVIIWPSVIDYMDAYLKYKYKCVSVD